MGNTLCYKGLKSDISNTHKYIIVTRGVQCNLLTPATVNTCDNCKLILTPDTKESCPISCNKTENTCNVTENNPDGYFTTNSVSGSGDSTIKNRISKSKKKDCHLDSDKSQPTADELISLSETLSNFSIERCIQTKMTQSVSVNPEDLDRIFIHTHDNNDKIDENGPKNKTATSTSVIPNLQPKYNLRYTNKKLPQISLESKNSLSKQRVTFGKSTSSSNTTSDTLLKEKRNIGRKNCKSVNSFNTQQTRSTLAPTSSCSFRFEKSSLDLSEELLKPYGYTSKHNIPNKKTIKSRKAAKISSSTTTPDGEIYPSRQTAHSRSSMRTRDSACSSVKTSSSRRARIAHKKKKSRTSLSDLPPVPQKIKRRKRTSKDKSISNTKLTPPLQRPDVCMLDVPMSVTPPLKLPSIRSRASPDSVGNASAIAIFSSPPNPTRRSATPMSGVSNQPGRQQLPEENSWNTIRISSSCGIQEFGNINQPCDVKQANKTKIKPNPIIFTESIPFITHTGDKSDNSDSHSVTQLLADLEKAEETYYNNITNNKPETQYTKPPFIPPDNHKKLPPIQARNNQQSGNGCATNKMSNSFDTSGDGKKVIFNTLESPKSPKDPTRPSSKTNNDFTIDNNGDSDHGTPAVEKTAKCKFYLKDSSQLEQILSDPHDRRIRSICDRYQCDLEVFSKTPRRGFLQYTVMMKAPNQEALRMCARALDSSLKWCISAQFK